MSSISQSTVVYYLFQYIYIVYIKSYIVYLIIVYFEIKYIYIYICCANLCHALCLLLGVEKKAKTPSLKLRVILSHYMVSWYLYLHMLSPHPYYKTHEGNDLVSVRVYLPSSFPLPGAPGPRIQGHPEGLQTAGLRVDMHVY